MTRTIYLPAAIGIAIGFTASVLQTNWTTAFIATAVSAVVLAALLAARGWWLANRQIEQTVNQVAPRPADFAADLVPAQHQPALYDLTVHRVGTRLPPRQYRNISSFELTRQLLDRGVPGDLASEESGDTTVNGSRITWAPSTQESC